MRPLHQRALLLVVTAGRGIGYELGGVPYGLVSPGGEQDVVETAWRTALHHAAALDLLDLHAPAPAPRPGDLPAGLRLGLLEGPADPGPARQAARFALALDRLARDEALSGEDEAVMRRESGGPPGAEVVIHADGSADKRDGRLSVGYTLSGRPYAALLHERGHEHQAEREAIRLALVHARLLGHTRFRVQSDHRFHVRRYAEDLVYRGRPKSASLERLDALVGALGSAVTFAYTPTQDTDAPHRLAVHARALHRLASGQPLSRAGQVALRRVHFARRAGRPVPY